MGTFRILRKATPTNDNSTDPMDFSGTYVIHTVHLPNPKVMLLLPRKAIGMLKLFYHLYKTLSLLLQYPNLYICVLNMFIRSMVEDGRRRQNYTRGVIFVPVRVGE
jgi:hypothetical protein